MNRKLSLMLAAILAVGFVGTTRAGVYKLVSKPSSTDSVIIASAEDLGSANLLTVSGSEVKGAALDTTGAVQQYWALTDTSVMSGNQYLKYASSSFSLTEDPSEVDTVGVNFADGKITILVDTAGGGKKYLKLDATPTADAAETNLFVFAQGKAWAPQQSEEAPFSLDGGKHFLVAQAAQPASLAEGTTLEFVDAATYGQGGFANDVWTVEGGQVLTPDKEQGVKFTEEGPTLVDKADASVIDNAGGALALATDGAYTSYINALGEVVADPSAAAQGGDFSSDLPGFFTDSIKAVDNALLVTKEADLTGADKSYRLVYYNSTNGALGEAPYIWADTAQTAVGVVGHAYPTADSAAVRSPKFLPAFYWWYDAAGLVFKSKSEPGYAFVPKIKDAGVFQTYNVVIGKDKDGNYTNTFILKSSVADTFLQVSDDGKEFTLAAKDKATRFSALPTAYTVGVTATELTKKLSSETITISGFKDAAGNPYTSDVITDQHQLAEKDLKENPQGTTLFTNLELITTNTPDNDTIYQLHVAGENYVVLDTAQNWNKGGAKVIAQGPDLQVTGSRFDTIPNHHSFIADEDSLKADPDYDVSQPDTAIAGIHSYFTFYKADDGSDFYVGKVFPKTNPTADEDTCGFLYVTDMGGHYFLTTTPDTAKASVFSIKAGEAAPEDPVVTQRIKADQLLTGEFYNVEYINQTEETGERYKIGGLLAVVYNEEHGNKAAHAEYITLPNDSLKEVYKKYPEAQWAVAKDKMDNDAEPEKGVVILRNRENPNVEVYQLVMDSVFDAEDVPVPFTFVVDSAKNVNAYGVTDTLADANVNEADTLKFTPVENVDEFDGFLPTNAVTLRDQVYNIGASLKDVHTIAWWYEIDPNKTHRIGLDSNVDLKGRWNLYQHPTDTVKVVSTLYTSKGSTIESETSTLKILKYAIQNADNNEFVMYNDEKNLEYFICDPNNENFGSVFNNDILNDVPFFALKLRPNGTYHVVVLGKELNEDAMLKKVYAHNAVGEGVLKEANNYTGTYMGGNNDLMVIEPTEQPEYRRFSIVEDSVEVGLDTIQIFTDDENALVLYEKKDSLNPQSTIPGSDPIDYYSFLNSGYNVKYPALFVDTAYVDRAGNNRWQYLLAVDVKEGDVLGYHWECKEDPEHNTDAWLQEHGILDENGVLHCPHAEKVQDTVATYKEGRYLVNLVDTANAYASQAQMHGNPFVNESNKNAKLAFVWARHFADNKLAFYKGPQDWTWEAIPEDATVWGDTLDLNTPDLKKATFAFRYEDYEAGSFKIQTQYKEYGNPSNVHDDGYIRLENGTVVVAEGIDQGDVFDLEPLKGVEPTENESITASGVVVAGVDGAVVVKGAEGKTVVVTTILGKVVANKVLTSDNATVAAPAGIVVVSVDGESYKVVVR